MVTAIRAGSRHVPMGGVYPLSARLSRTGPVRSCDGRDGDALLRRRALAHVRMDHAALAVPERRQNEIAGLELFLADRAGKIGVAAGALDSDHFGVPFQSLLRPRR